MTDYDKYVTLRITTRIDQEDFNCLVRHLKDSENYHFLVKCEVYTDSDYEDKEKNEMKTLLVSGDDYNSSSYCEYSKKIANY